MRLVESVHELREAVRGWRSAGHEIGLVPTMGALHEGHLSLVRASRRRCARTVVTIFVNPIQFGPNEDLDRYPRDLEGDSQRLESIGADLLFTPTPELMYPSGFQTHVEPGPLSETLCGRRRHGHFRGVTTVVTKLFHLVEPDQAFFGQKDYQQARVLLRMVEDLQFGLSMHIVPTVRESDGLALSSRNEYLGDEKRAAAPGLHASLRAVAEAYSKGERKVASLIEIGRQRLQSSGPFEIEYYEVLDDETLRAPEHLGESAVVAAAAHLGPTRLIDNVLLGEAEGRLTRESRS